MKMSAFGSTTVINTKLVELRLHSRHGTKPLHSRKGKGMITPKPDTSGLGVTGGP